MLLQLNYVKIELFIYFHVSPKDIILKVNLDKTLKRRILQMILFPYNCNNVLWMAVVYMFLYNYSFLGVKSQGEI